jgi:hypothetical protein
LARRFDVSVEFCERRSRCIRSPIEAVGVALENSRKDRVPPDL